MLWGLGLHRSYVSSSGPQFLPLRLHSLLRMGSLENSGQSSGEIGVEVTFREAKRPLAGDPRNHETGGVIYGEYTASEYHWPTGYAGKPAISVNIGGGRSGTRTYIGKEGMETLIDLIDDLGKAYLWLKEQENQ